MKLPVAEGPLVLSSERFTVFAETVKRSVFTQFHTEGRG
jgi:hypothetical protein